MSSSRSKNFRRRPTDSDDTPDPTPITTTSKPSTSTKPSTSSNPRKPHQKLLSFADDDDDDDDNESSTPFSRPPPPPKPSSSSSTSKPPTFSSSHKLKDRAAGPAPRSNVQPQAGTYTKEALLELQKNTKTLASSSSKPPPDPVPRSNPEPIVILKGIIKPTEGNKLDNNDDEEEEEEGEEEVQRRRMGRIDIRKGIPDQAMISKIKAEKERIRLSGTSAAPEYISLEGGNHGPGMVALSDDDDDDEEPEFRERVVMIGDMMKEGDDRKGVFEDVEEREVSVRGRGVTSVVDVGGEYGEEDDEDEEDRKWEEEQVRKALGKRLDDGMSNGSRVGGVGSGGVVQSVKHDMFSVGGAQQGFEGLSLAQQADIAIKALHENVMKLKETHEKTTNALNRSDENLSIALTNVTDLESRSTAVGEKYIFMQKQRDFVSVTCDFLQHKGPYVEELEEQMQQLRKEHASSIWERRAADLDDEMLEIEAAIKAAVSVFNRSGANASTISDASKAAQAAMSSTREQALPVELDEMGRDLNLKKRMDMTRRAEARRRRKARRDPKRMSAILNGSCQRIEGESSTDESEDESAAYQSHRNLLLLTAEQVFSDAAEEYSDLSKVKGRFEEWKKKYPSTYHGAYLPLSVPAIFSPYVRLELLKWDPLHKKTDFDDMKWHNELFCYGAPKENSGWNPDDDDDAVLVPRLVEKVALPLLLHDVTHCWDVLSSRETRNVVSATTIVVEYFPASSEAIIELISAIRTRLADAVADLMVPTWGALVMKAVPRAAGLGAYQFGVALRLMRNICLWKDVLASQVLEKLALDELLTGKMLPHVRMLTSDVHDAIARLERVVDSLSGVWSGKDVTGMRSSKLQPLVDYVVVLGKTLEKRQASGVTQSETSLLARRLKKMLVDIHEYDVARAILKTFHLKEAL